MADILTTVGLVLDLVGVAILFFHGLPPSVVRVGDSGMLTEGSMPPEQHERWSRGALVLIFIGFSLQGVAVWVS